ncbi:hypothetical protein DBV23_01075 [Edwardsiella ictaluri]|uniref:Pilus assembly protein E-set like domain-containing protein n=3 Tax=Edwardsiella ictaluri TaxID=67780 RepID=C5BFH2_EDWI9|nr:hypothetical protein NT01EI_1503 [Edwardsiella ictaluri 93-146]AVZ81038.1 hypothetical protein DBV23_01075 [Edwardsiella ictaluri]EKS7808169.1 TcfC E-set like domain-containing protein [Edwardsiella ictaluri]
MTMTSFQMSIIKILPVTGLLAGAAWAAPSLPTDTLASNHRGLAQGAVATQTLAHNDMTLAQNNATLAMAHGMSLASGVPLARSRYGKILTPSPMAITLVIPQVDEARFEGELALDSVRIDDSAAVAAFLSRAGLSQKQADEVARQFAAGVSHDSRCKGSRATCVLSSEGMAVVIDYYARQVRLFFAPAYFARETRQVEYLQGDEGKKVLVNHASLFANRYANQGNSLYARDYGLWGLPGGFLKYDAYVTDRDYGINALNYVYQYQWFKAQLGAVDNSYDFNPSAQRSLFKNSQMTALLLGNSAEMQVRSQNDRHYTYYAPLPGVLEVWRDDKLLLRRGVNAGMGELAYQSLPTGIYQARVVIKGLNDELFSDQSLLLVNDGPTLEGVSTHLSVGRLDDHAYYGNAWMGELGVTVPLGDIVSLSGLTGYADREFLGTLGADIRSSNLTLSLLQTLGSQGYQKSDLVATYYPLSLQYTRERYRQRERPFVRTLPGAVEPDDVLQPSLIPDYLDQHPGMSANRENLLANYSVALHQDHTLQLGYQFFREQSQRSQYYTLSLFSRLPWNINLTASLNYARNDLWSASVGLSVPIGSLQASSYYSQQNAGRWRSQNTLNYSQSLAEAWLVNLQGGQQFSDNGAQTTFSAGAQYRGSADVRAQVYLASDQSGAAGSLDVQSSQLIASDGISFQRPDALSQQAFLRLPAEEKGAVSVALKEQSSGMTRYYTEGGGKIIALPAYSRYQLDERLIGGSRVFDNHQSRYQQQIDLLPGRLVDTTRAVLPVRNQAIRVRQQGNGVDQLRCEGAGCIGVQRIQSGLFMLQLHPTGAITLLSEGRPCASLSSALQLPADQLPIVECKSE